MEDKIVENLEDEQVVEFVGEIDEEIMSVIYRLYDKTLRDLAQSLKIFLLLQNYFVLLYNKGKGN